MNNSHKNKLIAESRRQEEACLYTSTTLYIWLRSVRRWKGLFVILPILLGSVASWSILKGPENSWIVSITAVAGLVAGLLPAIRDALTLDVHAGEISRLAAEFKNLQDRFRILAETGEFKEETELERGLQKLLNRLDEARKSSPTPPERFFVNARKKIGKGHYKFSVDEGDPAT